MQLDAFTSAELSSLMGETREFCVSIFMPTFRKGEAEQNPIRVKNLLRKADEKLKARGVRTPERYFQPVRSLMNDTKFWEHVADGLALFLTEEELRLFRLPLQFPEAVIVNTRFYIKPLLPLLSEEKRFYILALSQNMIRILRATRFSVEELEPTDMPKSLFEAMQYDEPQKQLQWHSQTMSGISGGGVSPGTKRSPYFYGTGDGTDDAKDRILRYFREVDKGVREMLPGNQIPLVLAGVDYLLPIYREANTYPRLLEGGIEGNPDGLRPDELHVRAWDVLEPVISQPKALALDKYARLAGTGTASSDLALILPAAAHGRVETLFVALGQRKWGHFDPQLGTIEIHPQEAPGDEDLLDLAALHAVKNSGMVYALSPEEVPGGSVIAAVFRY
jgi:hypothetical protein